MVIFKSPVVLLLETLFLVSLAVLVAFPHALPFAVLNGALCDLIHLWLFKVVFVLPGHAQFLQVLVNINLGEKAFKTSIVMNC